MEPKTMDVEALSKELTLNKKNGFFQVDDEEIARADQFCEDYKVFMDASKTEREATEEAIRRALVDRYPRDSFCVADKFNVQAEPDHEKQFARQLERLQMDRIDFYLLHGVTDKLISDYLDHGAPEYFREQKRLGKIRYFGFSFHGSPDALRQMLARGPWDFVQIQLNYYDWFHGTAREQYEILREHGIPIMVMEPAHGGMLADLPEAGRDLLLTAKPGATAASWAFRFLRTLPGIAVVLSGMSELGQAKDNIQTFSDDKLLSEEEISLVRQVSDVLHGLYAVPCTG